VLLEEDDPRTTSGFRVSWRRWLASQGLGQLEPRGWIYLNYTHQQVQGALAGQGIALARMPLVHDLIERGELVELFGGRCRLGSESTYYLIEMPLAIRRVELSECAEWIRTEATRTRAALGEAATP
jgi:LysR family glycine cleavage system transcriptional activator